MFDSEEWSATRRANENAEQDLALIDPHELSAIAKRVRQHHIAGDKAAGSALVNYFEAGRLLLTVKASLPQKAFLKWLKTDCDTGTQNASVRTWQRYMALAQIICARTGLPTAPDEDPHATRASHVDLFLQNDFTSVRQVLALRGPDAVAAQSSPVLELSKLEPAQLVKIAHERHAKADATEQQPLSTSHIGYRFTSHDHWISPPELVSAAERVLGRIDLDPCGSLTPTLRLRAKTIYTPETNGLDASNPWKGNAYIFPPRTVISNWIDRLIAEFQGGSLKQSLALLPAFTDEDWFKRVSAFPCAFLFERLCFASDADSPRAPADCPYAVIYLGEEVNRFAAGFREFGQIYIPYVAST